MRRNQNDFNIVARCEHAILTWKPPLPPPPLGKANGIFAFGVYVGGGLSSLSIAMAEGIGWRASAYTVAAYGLCLSLVVRFTVREPARIVSDPAAGDRSSQPIKDEEGDKDFTFMQRWAFLDGGVGGGGEERGSVILIGQGLFWVSR